MKSAAYKCFTHGQVMQANNRNTSLEYKTPMFLLPQQFTR